MIGNADPTETIGNLIAQIRTDLGITQLRLAERLCAASGTATVTRNEVSRWERAERIPSGFWLGWLAVVLEVPVQRLERASGAARRLRHGRPPPREPSSSAVPSGRTQIAS
jgi:transcriptional regulator with XRE-family HTH domain